MNVAWEQRSYNELTDKCTIYNYPVQVEDDEYRKHL